jgi:hypothetical protein
MTAAEEMLADPSSVAFPVVELPIGVPMFDRTGH